MDSLRKLAVISSMVTLVILLVPFNPSFAEITYDREYNCNSYEPEIFYTGGTSDLTSVEYYVRGFDDQGNEVEVHSIGYTPSVANNWTLRLDPEDLKKCKYILITQTAIKDDKADSKTFKVNFVKPSPKDDPFEVRYYDGYTGTLLDTRTVTSSSIEVGKPFVDLPLSPVRDGYSFLGWFLPTDNPEVFIPFDPTVPVESDLEVFAKWSYSGGVDPDDPDKPLPTPGEKVVSLSVGKGYKFEYMVGQSLDTKGLEITALFSDGHQEDVTSRCTYSPVLFDHLGKITVTAEYKGVSTTFDVMVVDNYVPGGDEDNEGGGSGGQSHLVENKTDALVYVLLVLVILMIAFIAYRELRQRRS